MGLQNQGSWCSLLVPTPIITIWFLPTIVVFYLYFYISALLALLSVFPGSRSVISSLHLVLLFGQVAKLASVYNFKSKTPSFQVLSSRSSSCASSVICWPGAPIRTGDDCFSHEDEDNAAAVPTQTSKADACIWSRKTIRASKAPAFLLIPH